LALNIRNVIFDGTFVTSRKNFVNEEVVFVIICRANRYVVLGSG
jgi:hypothetical protein